jgi:hypothetical protein
MRIRINDIECRFSQERYEIVKWYSNTYYGAEDRLISEGYEKVSYPNDRWQMKKDWHNIDMSCFVNPESCYTIATLHYDSDEGCCDMKTVGPRLLELSKTERADFFAVYEYAEDKIREEELARTEEPEF